MKSFLSIDSPIIAFLTKLADMILLNLAFILLSVPVFTIGASTTALYRVMIDRKNQDESGILPLFSDAFCENFKSSTKLFLILLLPQAIAVYYTMMLFEGAFSYSTVLTVISLIVVIVFEMIWSFTWPLQAKYENTPGRIVKNALLLSLAHLPTALIMSVLNVLPTVVLLWKPYLFVRISIIWILFGFALTAKINTALADKVFATLIPPESPDEEK